MAVCAISKPIVVQESIELEELTSMEEEELERTIEDLISDDDDEAYSRNYA